MKKSSKILMTILLTSLSLNSFADEKKNVEAKVVLRVAINENSSESAKSFADKFKKRIEEKTQQRVVVQLKNIKEQIELESIQLGAVEMVLPDFSYLKSGPAKEFAIFDLPYLYSNVDKINSLFVNPEVLDSISLPLEKRHLKVVGLGFLGFNQMLVNKKVGKATDLSDVTFATQSAVEKNIVANLKAKSIELQSKKDLSNGKFTGIFVSNNDIPNVKRVLPNFNIVETNHSIDGYAVIMNNTFWNKTPEVYRAEIRDAVIVALKEINFENGKKNDEASFTKTEEAKDIYNSFLKKGDKGVVPRIDVVVKYANTNDDYKNITNKVLLTYQGQPESSTQAKVVQAAPVQAAPVTAPTAVSTSAPQVKTNQVK